LETKMATFQCRVQFLDDTDPFSSTNFPEPTRPPSYTFLTNVPLVNQIAGVRRQLCAPHKLEDCALQLYKYTGSQGEYGTYLDLESTIDEQWDELEGFTDQRKNTIILRTQLSVRVHAVIEKLLNASGRELRRALFSLKQIFQDDKDLVHEFVNNDGLMCLIKVGSEADQNYQNYILRALGQVMLYVDGMNGVIAHPETLQWLYSLIASKFRLVVKTSLKLLLVFVEYTESNTSLLLNAFNDFDKRRGAKPWVNIMNILNEKEGGDSELLVYASTLVNKVLNAIPDQDSFYDLVDSLEEQGIEKIIKKHMEKKGAADIDLLEQFQIYEAVLKAEDGEDDPNMVNIENLRRTPRQKSEDESRKSRRYSTGNQPATPPTGRSMKLQQTLPTTSEHPEDKNEDPRERRRRERRECARKAAEEQEQQKNMANQQQRWQNREQTPELEDSGRRRRRQRQDENEDKTPPPWANQHTEPESKMDGGQSSDTPRRIWRPPVNDEEVESSPEPVKQSSFVPRDRRRRERRERQRSLTKEQSQLTKELREAISKREEGKEWKSPDLEVNRTYNSPMREPQESQATVQSSLEKETDNNIDSSKLEERTNVSESGTDTTSSTLENDEVFSNKDTNTTRTSIEKTKLPTTEGDNISLASTTSTLSTLSSASCSSLTTLQDSSVKNPSVGSLSDMENRDLDDTVRPMRKQFRRSSALEDGEQELIPNHKYQNSSESGYLSTGESHDQSHDQQNYNDIESHNNRRNESLNQQLDNAPLSPTSLDQPSIPAGISNNKRWMLYKISSMKNKEAQQAAEQQLTELNKGFSMDGDSLSSRIENLQRGGDTLMPGGPDDLNNQGTVQSVAGMIGSQNGIDPGSAKSPTGDLSGLIGRAKDGLISKPLATVDPSEVQGKQKTESEVQWDMLRRTTCRPLKIHGLDFTDLQNDGDLDVLNPPIPAGQGGIPPPPGGGIPPPPPGFGLPGMIPPPPSLGGPPPPPPPFGAPPPPPPGNTDSLQRKSKTVRLHWRELQNNTPNPVVKDSIWDRLSKVTLDKEKLEHLFETRNVELKTKKGDTSGKKENIVLDPKRSNAINIGMTVLPPPRTIKTAILKMDSAIMNREGIDKILSTMIPTDEEKTKILEAQMANPDLPLGTAEQFLLTLSSVSELKSRLELWAFKLDYDSAEEEVAEPLMDLKQAIDDLKANRTFKNILATLLAIGSILNGHQVKGFNLEYLARVPEVKDTVHKHSLLHHLCGTVMEQFPDSTDLYSEIGAIARCAKVDWDELSLKLGNMESDCKTSWDNLRTIAKHDSNSPMKTKLSEFLSDCAERIIVLKIVHKRVLNRFNKLLLYLGYSVSMAKEVKVSYFCKVVSEFSLEYRTTREKVMIQRQKKANNRERRKTRGKMIVDTGKFAKPKEDDMLKKVLTNGHTGSENEKENTNSLPGARTRKRMSMGSVDNLTVPRRSNRHSQGGTDSESVYDTQDDEMLEACLKTATTTPSGRAPRERRRRARDQNRKSLRRTLKNGLTDEEKHDLLAQALR
ncbi:unnamed protein product, partial [Owenia fusiformis]